MSHPAHVGNVGGGCPVGDRVRLTSSAFRARKPLGGARAVETVVTAEGDFSAFAMVSSTATAGRHEITARCGTHQLASVAYLQVDA
jgi:hypothetical protein